MNAAIHKIDYEKEYIKANENLKNDQDYIEANHDIN